MTRSIGRPVAAAGRTDARPATPQLRPGDVDRVLAGQYLAAVMGELDRRRVPVDGAFMHEPARCGGTVVFGLTGDPATDRRLPLHLRWDARRGWTLLISCPERRTGVRHVRLHGGRTPTPGEIAEFVASALQVGGPTRRWWPGVHRRRSVA